MDIVPFKGLDEGLGSVMGGRTNLYAHHPGNPLHGVLSFPNQGIRKISSFSLAIRTVSLRISISIILRHSRRYNSRIRKHSSFASEAGTTGSPVFTADIAPSCISLRQVKKLVGVQTMRSGHG
mgnify:FL=1